LDYFSIIEQADMFWRMGIGESYLADLFNFINNYGKEKYKAEYPEPVEWRNFYM
jgi:hypothetical protein